eukprot:5791022-Amphidinium_carterae.1
MGSIRFWRKFLYFRCLVSSRIFSEVLRGEEHRWQQDSRVREELQSEFAGLKDAMQREVPPEFCGTP